MPRLRFQGDVLLGARQHVLPGEVGQVSPSSVHELSYDGAAFDCSHRSHPSPEEQPTSR